MLSPHLQHEFVKDVVILPNVGRPCRSDELEVRLRDNVVKRCSERIVPSIGSNPQCTETNAFLSWSLSPQKWWSIIINQDDPVSFLELSM